jgi:hypothetical protein
MIVILDTQVLYLARLTHVGRSRLMSRGPHRAGIRAILTVEALVSMDVSQGKAVFKNYFQKLYILLSFSEFSQNLFPLLISPLQNSWSLYRRPLDHQISHASRDSLQKCQFCRAPTITYHEHSINDAKTEYHVEVVMKARDSPISWSFEETQKATSAIAVKTAARP